MKIYLAHSRNIDYVQELYKPIREDKFFSNYEIILPHEENYNKWHTRDFYKEIDLFIADVTEPGTGLGIELGWAYDDGKKIFCIYKYGSKISNSLKHVTDEFYAYNNSMDLIKIIKDIINKESDLDEG